jgi:SecD/SecF fusion protein
MPTNISGRLTLIAAVLFLALWAIFPNGNLKHPNLRPGIDMVGGTSLLYEIKAPEGTGYTNGLAEDVMESLKKRVDPDGVRNLVWRPQGNTRLEIQMPLTAKTEQAKQLREQFAKAQQTVEDTNVPPGEAIYVVQELKGEERAAKIKELEKGSPTRGKILAAMATTWDQIQQAKSAKNAAEQAKLEDQYDKLVNEFSDTNLSSNQLQEILDLKKQETRDERLAELKTKFADYPQRLAAIDNFTKEYADYSNVKESIDDAGELKRLLRGSGVLEFHILANDLSAQQQQEMIERLKSRGPIAHAGDEVRWYQAEKPDEFKGQAQEWNEKFYVLCYTTPDQSMTHAENQPNWQLAGARSTVMNGERIVEFTFDPEGGQLFGHLTGGNLHRQLAIVLDNKLISAPNINSQIFGSGQISGGRGGFSEAEVNYLVRTLNAGSLKAQLTDEPISEQTVGPQLGEDNLRAGLLASILGLVVVAIFLVIYYHISGIVAVIALVMNMILILGAMAALNATWTLPAVAGIVLTIGMSVDANVLVFERLREETQRGLPLRMALRNAYDRAASAIIDSNAITAITCLILYWIGSEEVKGFGLTLLIGIVSSLFTALFVTKTIFTVMLDKFNLQHLGSLPTVWPAFGRLLHPNVHWMSKAKYFIAASLTLIILGGIALGVAFKRGELFDIEFSSGTSVQFELKQPTQIGEVRKLIAQAPETQLPSPSVVSVGSDNKTYEVVTPSNDSRQVTDAILTTLAGRLNLQEPSKFDLVDQTYDKAMDKAIFPITPQTRTIAGFAPTTLRTHIGGVAIVLKNLSTHLTADEIRARLEHERLQPKAGAAADSSQFQLIDVEMSADGNSAIVLTSDPNITYDANDPAKIEQWTQELAKPTWNLVRDAINNPPKLQKVSNFDAQVAGEMQQDALMALGLSVLVIMAYIWLRFGNLKYGTATVVAMLHDTLLVIGFIGLSHFIGKTSIGTEFLLVEPFRVNLTLVAAVLTVMSYSMVDTIVVFDRIRENRGKFGHVDPQIIDDSVNQTLSRTLLTAGTTVMTLFVMYIFGGPGIHGFTFVMLVGILVGTYSSIAIAAPILLIGEKKPQQASGRLGSGQLQRA